MNNKILELKCVDCVELDRHQFVATLISDGEKYQLTLREKVPKNMIIRMNTYYHLIQKFDDYFRISVKQDYLPGETPAVLDLFLADKYVTRNKEQVSVYKDSNTMEIFKIVEIVDNFKLNSNRLLNLKIENLIILKEAHIFNGNYIIENWIHKFEAK